MLAESKSDSVFQTLLFTKRKRNKTIHVCHKLISKDWGKIISSLRILNIVKNKNMEDFVDVMKIIRLTGRILRSIVEILKQRKFYVNYTFSKNEKNSKKKNNLLDTQKWKNHNEIMKIL